MDFVEDEKGSRKSSTAFLMGLLSLEVGCCGCAIPCEGDVGVVGDESPTASCVGGVWGVVDTRSSAGMSSTSSSSACDEFTGGVTRCACIGSIFAFFVFKRKIAVNKTLKFARENESVAGSDPTRSQLRSKCKRVCVHWL